MICCLSIQYIYIYIYCHPQTDCFVLSEFFSVAKHIQHSKPGSKPIQLYVRLSLRPLGQQTYHVWLRELLRYLFSNSSSRLFTFFIPYRLPECSILSKSFALCERRPKIPSALSYGDCVINPGWRLMRIGCRTCFHTLYDEKEYTYIYIYIYLFICVCVCVCVCVC